MSNVSAAEKWRRQIAEQSHSGVYLPIILAS